MLQWLCPQWTLLYSPPLSLALCQFHVYPSLCLICQMFRIGLCAPAACTGQGEQVKSESESSEKAQLSEIRCQVLQWCQTLRVPHILLEPELSRGTVFAGIRFPAPPALATWPGFKACACTVQVHVHAHRRAINHIKRQPGWGLKGAWEKTKGKWECCRRKGRRIRERV